jgi:hypothetical protein
VALSREQQRVLDVLLAEGQRITNPHVRRVFNRAAVETGLVESGLTNPSGGDADSAGWRQERASLYKNPTDLAASARRFRQEFLAAYSAGKPSWQIAAEVQRPRADLRGRYREVAGQAAQILAGANVGRGGATGSVTPAGTSSSPAGPSALGLTADTSSGVDVSSLLTMLGQQQHRQAPTSGGLPAPAFTAQAAMPGGYQALASGGGPAPKQDLGALLSLVQTQGSTGQPTGAGAVSGAAPPLPAIQAPRSSSGSGRDGRVSVAAGANRPGAPINPAVTSFVRGVAGLYGQPLTIGTGTNHNRLTINGTESDHWTGNGADIPLAGRALIRAGQDALIQAGMSPAKARKQTGGGYNVGGWQVIFNTNAPGWGDHLTHLHVGRRAR